MTDTINPALTPEQWDSWKRDGELPDDLPLYIKGQWADEIVMDGRVEGKERGTVAALCLHGQSFGFTREDLRAIDLGMTAEQFLSGEDVTFRDKQLQSLRDRIEALLPPE